MNSIKPYAKAVTGAIVAGLGAAAVGVKDGTWDLGDTISVAIAFFTGLGFVWAVPNTDPDGTHQAESVQSSRAGDTLRRL